MHRYVNFNTGLVVFLIGSFFAHLAHSEDICVKDFVTRSGQKMLNRCPDGTRLFEGRCTMLCPEGFTDEGMDCKKPPKINRGTLWVNMDNCMKANPNGCERSFGAIYPKCDDGYFAETASICSRICPSSTTDMGILHNSCTKAPAKLESEYRACPLGKEESAGACYAPCEAGFKGLGSVCFKTCPDEFPVDCAGACGKMERDCEDATLSQAVALTRVITHLNNSRALNPNIVLNLLKKDISKFMKTATVTDVIEELSESMSILLARRLAQFFVGGQSQSYLFNNDYSPDGFTMSDAQTTSTSKAVLNCSDSKNVDLKKIIKP